MTKSERQLQELHDMGVMVVSRPDLCRRRSATAFRENFLVLGELHGEKQTNAVLTHEKWHYRLGAFYQFEAPYEQRSQAEARANRAALQELVPKQRLALLLRKGLSVSEIAEALDVNEIHIWEAWRLYRELDQRYCTDEE